jgi:K+-sensing histidine kinase KdpD
MATTHSRQLRVIRGGLAERGPRAVLDEQAESTRRWGNAEGMLAGYCVIAAATIAVVAAGGTRHPLVALVVLALALLAATRRMTLPASLACGVMAWLFYDGFVIGRHGDLAWAGVREAWWLLVLLATAACGTALGHRILHQLR